MNIATLLQQAKALFAEDAQQAVEILLATVLQKPRSYLYAWPDFELSVEQQAHFREGLQRLQQNEPLAYLLGKTEFWSLPLHVNKHTLIPRPETEILVQAVLDHFPKTQPINVADLGTGSGAIALAIKKECPSWEVHAADVSAEALAVARLNAMTLQSHIHFYQGDWCAPLLQHHFQVIAANPPYISEEEWPQYAAGLQYEPRGALVSGPDGLNDIRTIVTMAKKYLCANGMIFIEHGYQQGHAVRELLKKAQYENVRTLKDLSQLPRVTVGRLSSH